MSTKVSEPQKDAKAAQKAESTSTEITLGPPPATTEYKTERSGKLFERAQKVLPGGVNSPVRACRSVGSDPIFFAAGDGPYMEDVDGNTYVDLCGSWGALILGHGYPSVQQAVEDALKKGTSFGAPTPAEVEMGELVTKLVPSIEMVRMVNSGTEATMSAIRLARAFTKKQVIVKFDGCYHGHADSFLVKAGSGLATLGISSSAGVPDEVSKLSVSLPYNDLGAVEKAFKEHKDNVAALIVEPIAANAGLILPTPEFLQGLRDLATKYGALLIFDEVITGFRVALGGAQSKFNIKPDLTCLGKIIGGGLPVGAYGGRKEIMELVAPLGAMYQAGTLSGNPLAMAAGVAQLKALQHCDYKLLEERTKAIADGIAEIAKKAKHAVMLTQTCGLFCVFFAKGEIHDFSAALKSDTDKFSRFWKAMTRQGIYWPPSQFEAAFVSMVHTKKEVELILKAAEQAFNEL